MKNNFKLYGAALAALLMTGCYGGKGAADDILIDDFEEELIDYVPDETEQVTEEIFAETEEPPEAAYSDGGAKLRVYCRNSELKEAFESMYGDAVPDISAEIEFVIDEDFFSADDHAGHIKNQVVTSKDSGDPIDIFITEPVYIYSHINDRISLPLSAVGITDGDTADMFPYTISLGTAENGELKAVSWQAEPGVFVYRRDIALEVFDSGDPDYIASLLAEDYANAAEMLRDKGYYITGSTEETFRTYAQNSTKNWLDGSGNITVPDKARQWAEDMRRDVTEGFNGDYPMWTDYWCSGWSNSESAIFGYYLPVWGCEGTLQYNWQDGNGCWGVCTSPRPYHWGSLFLCVSAYTDNITACGEFLRAVCCDGDAAVRYASGADNFANNMTAMQYAAESAGFYSGFFGQNPYKVYYEAAMDIPCRVPRYGDFIGEQYASRMDDYIKGYEDREQCEDKFIKYAKFLLED